MTIKELYKIPEFIKSLDEIKDDPNCNKIQVNIIDIYPGLRLFFPELNDLKFSELDKLDNCELLALKYTITKYENMIFRNVRNIE